MEKKITEFTLITQNVDGLHRMAGSANILELHGSILKVRCSECGTFAETWDDDFDSVPRAQLEAAVNAARTCEVFFSVGTSGVVQPAAALAHAARNKGAVLVKINLDPTPLTPKVDFAFHGKSREILPELVKILKKTLK